MRAVAPATPRRDAARPWRLALAAAVLLKVPVPLWPAGFPLLATLSTLALALAALLWAWERSGPRALGLFALAFGGGLGVEALGTRTGFPFGAYAYGPVGPALLGVPLLVPLGWWAMGLAAADLSGGRPLLTGLLMVAWDLGLEPLMTREGFWSWAGEGLWFGAPAANFAGWLAVGALLGVPLGRLASGSGDGFGVAYRLEALFLPAGLALAGSWGAAVVAGAAMNGLAWWPRARRAG